MFLFGIILPTHQPILGRFTCTQPIYSFICYLAYFFQHINLSWDDLHVLSLFIYLFIIWHIPSNTSTYFGTIYMYSANLFTYLLLIFCVFVNYMYKINQIIRMRDQATSTAGKTGKLWYDEMSVALRHLNPINLHI